MWRAIVYPILTRLAPKLIDALVGGKTLDTITLGELLSELDKNKLERLAAEARARHRVSSGS